MMSKEMVHHPAHYGGEGNPFEPIKVIEHYNLNFSLGSAIKYILRHDKKGCAIQDLRKAAWFITREADRLEMMTSSVPEGEKVSLQPETSPDTRGDEDLLGTQVEAMRAILHKLDETQNLLAVSNPAGTGSIPVGTSTPAEEEETLTAIPVRKCPGCRNTAGVEMYETSKGEVKFICHTCGVEKHCPDFEAWYTTHPGYSKLSAPPTEVYQLEGLPATSSLLIDCVCGSPVAHATIARLPVDGGDKGVPHVHVICSACGYTGDFPNLKQATLQIRADRKKKGGVRV